MIFLCGLFSEWIFLRIAFLVTREFVLSGVYATEALDTSKT